MFNIHDLDRNAYMLDGPFAKEGYDWWWHSFTGVNRETGEEKQFFVEYFIINPDLGGAEPVFGQLPENKAAGIRPSYVMIKAGCWGKGKCQLHRFFGIGEMTITERAPYRLTVGACMASDGRLRGNICITPEETATHPEWMCDAGIMSWNLDIEKKIAFNVGYGASAPFRWLKAFEMYWHAEGMKSCYSGTVSLNGEIYDVIPEKSYGYADKNWGRGFTSPWVWLSSNCMKSLKTGKVLENSVFDFGGGRPKVFFVPLDRKLLGGFYYEGREFEYNFSKFWQLPGTKFTFHENNEYVYWRVFMQNRSTVIRIDVRCKKSDMLLVNYEAPDGSKRHNRLWNGGNGVGRIRLYGKTRRGLTLIDDIRATHIGCEYGEYD